MYGRRAFKGLDISSFRLTRLRVAAVCASLLAVALTLTIVQFSQSRDLVMPSGGVIGGDYLAFHTAGRAALSGEAAAIYDPTTFEARLHEFGPEQENFGLTWQYPPTYYFLAVPLSLLDYLPGYALFLIGGMGALLLALRRLGANALTLFAAISSPSFFHAAITGQNGFLTAALIAVAAFYPDRRPLLAGAAAALLTMKPQLGALIPLAYMAGGCWRAFAAAALGALALAAASLLAFGFEAWSAFIGGALGASGNLQSGALPLYKMLTPYAAMRVSGAPLTWALAIHGVIALAAAGLVWRVWRKSQDGEMRAAVLIAGVFLVTPYGYYYEAVLLAAPLALIARRALADGWLKHEQIGVAAAFLLPLTMPGSADDPGAPWGLLAVLIVFASALRRALPGEFSVISKRTMRPA